MFGVYTAASQDSWVIELTEGCSFQECAPGAHWTIHSMHSTREAAQRWADWYDTGEGPEPLE